MNGRRARDDEVQQWRDDGWVVVDGLVATDTIDEAVADLWNLFPKPEKFHQNPQRYIPVGKRTEDLRRGYPEMPEHGPAFRPEQHRWGHEFPFYNARALSRLAVHPAIVDFAERALATTDIRVYQTHVSAKYTGDADYEQPMHTDRNHSYLPAVPGPPWSQVQTFLFLTDIDEESAPTHVVSRTDARGRSTNSIFLPADDPEIYAREHSACGVRGSLMAYRNDVFHRGVDITKPSGARFMFNVSFKVAGLDWVGYHSVQSNATHPGWTQFVEESTPRDLELFGFPPPGHPVWTPSLIEATELRYPKLDLEPWRLALRQ